MGFTAGTTVSTKYFAPAQYKKLYAKIDVVFEEGETMTAFVVPKLQLNSKLMLESLNSILDVSVLQEQRMMQMSPMEQRLSELRFMWIPLIPYHRQDNP